MGELEYHDQNNLLGSITFGGATTKANQPDSTFSGVGSPQVAPVPCREGVEGN